MRLALHRPAIISRLKMSHNKPLFRLLKLKCRQRSAKRHAEHRRLKMLHKFGRRSLALRRHCKWRRCLKRIRTRKTKVLADWKSRTLEQAIRASARFECPISDTVEKYDWIDPLLHSRRRAP